MDGRDASEADSLSPVETSSTQGAEPADYRRAASGPNGSGDPEDIVEPHDAQGTRSSPGSPTRMRWAGRTALAVASVTLLSLVVAATASDLLRLRDAPAPVGPPSPPAPPCEWLSNLVLDQRVERWWATVEAGLRGEPLPQTEQAIDVRVAEAFAPVYAHILEFLDWHYSVTGQYTQLAVGIVTLLQEWDFPRALVERLARSELIKALFEWLQGWETTRAILERLAGLELMASAVEQLDRFRGQVDERLFGGLSDRVRLAADEVEIVMRAEMGELIARRIRDEADLFPAGASARPDEPCSDVESVRTRLAYESMLEAAVPETVQRFTSITAPTGILSAAAGVRAASAARALMKGLSGRLSRRLLPGIGRLLGVGVGTASVAPRLARSLRRRVLHAGEQFLEELTSLVDKQRAGLRADLSARADEVWMTTLGPVTPAAR